MRPWLPLAVGALLLTAVACRRAPETVTVFHAAAFEPVLYAARPGAEQTLHVKLLTEGGGSRAVVERITQLGRTADLVLLADSGLFPTLGAARFRWRLDFAGDELVLGVGRRARRTDEAEKDWVPVLLDPEIRLARADETMGPIGYRTLLAWKLREQAGVPGLMDQLKGKSVRVVDDVARLAALLKAGDVDYAVLYKTTALAHDLRFIALDPAINLGAPDRDYSGAEVTVPRREGGREIPTIIRGGPIVYGLSIPTSAEHPRGGAALTRYLLQTAADLWSQQGFVLFKPRFYGADADYAAWADLATHAGAFGDEQTHKESQPGP